ncbi:MAG: hypothetical protein ABIO70_27700 [Pseudomonadota bacterium]
MRAPLLCLAVLGLAACNKGNSIHTRGDPPFEISSAKSVLWAQDPDTDTQEGMAVLVISEDDLGCDAITAHNMYYDLEDAILDGQGLMFVLEYDSWSGFQGTLDWEGLWMTGYGYGGDAERMMYPLAFSDGFLYMLGGYYGIGDSSWLMVDAWATGGVSGSYSTEYWSGDFHAENCGDWAPYQSHWDTGWDTGW